jgi:hypothetical protein
MSAMALQSLYRTRCGSQPETALGTVDKNKNNDTMIACNKQKRLIIRKSIKSTLGLESSKSTYVKTKAFLCKNRQRRNIVVCASAGLGQKYTVLLEGTHFIAAQAP